MRGNIDAKACIRLTNGVVGCDNGDKRSGKGWGFSPFMPSSVLQHRPMWASRMLARSRSTVPKENNAIATTQWGYFLLYESFILCGCLSGLETLPRVFHVEQRSPLCKFTVPLSSHSRLCSLTCSIRTSHAGSSTCISTMMKAFGTAKLYL